MSMTERSAAAIDEKLRSELDSHFQQLFVRFSKESLAWLALPPAWTGPLAEACRFPTGDLGLLPFLDRASGAGFCTRRASSPTAAGFSFWVPDGVRERILQKLKTDQAFGAARLQELANRIGHEILKADQQIKVPAVIGRWAELAAHSEKADETVSFLNDRVNHLVDADETGAASAWVDTGAALAASLGGALNSSVKLGTRRLELAYRKSQIEHHLDSFQERPEQTGTFLKLIEPDNPVWAIHYLGMGGVGKTMLLRHITGRLAPERGIPTSRIDFDHLSPDYPVRRPGQLLVELAVDLRSYATSTDVERRFNELSHRNDRLLEVLSGEPSPEEPLANIRRNEFEELLAAFTDLLVALPRPARAPIVLILDTCEELARLPARGGIQPGVEATFEILDRVHGKVPDVRVILAGRRLLASSGPGWRVDETRRSRTAAPLPRREFMSLHEIRGFDRGEAERFLTEKKKLAVSDDVLEKIIDRSREAGTVAPVVVEGVSPGDDPRFNPFDLALYANWIREDPAGVIDQIVAGKADPYVEMRIVYRLRGTPVEPLLPSLVLWGRFDRAMLECAVPDLGPDEVEQLFGRLADLEWIDVQQDEDLKTEYLEVDHNLYPRLLAYFSEPPRDQALEAAARELAVPLARLVETRLAKDVSVRGLTFELLNAALAAASPADAATMWNDLMRRVADNADWNWMQNVASRLLGEDRAVERRPGLRAGVLAALISSELHTGTATNLTASWEEIDRTASAYPDPATAKWLQDRACAGRVASILRTESSAPEDLLKRFWTIVETFEPAERDSTARPWAEQLAASVCAALAAIVERCDRPASRVRLIPDPHAIEVFAARLSEALYPAELPAFARTLAAEMRTEAPAVDDGSGLDERFSNDSPLQQRWMDWRFPEPLGDHLRLRLWTRWPLTRHQFAANWQRTFLVKDALKTIGSVESERLISLLVQFELADHPQVKFDVPRGPRPVKKPTLPDIQAADEKAYSPTRQSTCRAHDAVPPLFVTLAMAHLAVGNNDRALSLVSERLKAAEATRRDPATVRHAEIARLKIGRRIRMPQPGVLDRIQQSKDAPLVAETLAATALAGPDLVSRAAPPSLEQGDYALAHAWWSAQTALTGNSKRALQEAASGMFIQVALDSTAEGSLPEDVVSAFRLDRHEASLLVDGRSRGPGPLDDSARTGLRRSALSTDSRGTWPGSSRGDGMRWCAEIAFEEGELLALRLPARGAALLRFASSLYEGSSDRIGAWMSSIAAATAYWHAGNVEELRKTLETITKPAHARIIAREPGVNSLGLPPWEQWDSDNQPGAEADARRKAVLAKTEPSGGELLRELLGEEHVGSPVEWTGWRMRLALCRRLAQFDTTSAAEATLKALAAGVSSGLPGELQAFPELAESAAEIPKAESPAAAKPDRWVAREKRAFQICYVGLPLIFFYLALTGRLTPGPTSLFHHPPSLFAWPVIALVTITLGWLVVTYAGGGHGLPLSWLLALLVPVFLGLYWIVGWLAQLVLPWAVTPWWHLGFFVALLFVVPLAGPVTRRLQHWLTSVLAARGSLGISIGPWESGASAAVAIGGHRIAPRGLTFVDSVKISLQSVVPRPGSEAYAESAGRLPKEVRAPLLDYRNALGTRSLVVDVSLPAGDLAAVPWEAVLSLSSLKGGIDQDPLQFRRVLPGQRAASNTSPVSPRRLVDFLGEPSWVSMWAKGWSDSGAEVRRPVDATPIFLHILGEPVTTSRGVSMAIGGNRHASSPALDVTQRMSQSVSPPDLVSADDAVIAQAVAVLVQVEPADVVSRLDSDRQQAGYVRTFAASLVARGVERVITLPPLPAGLAESVLEAITPALVDPARKSLTDAIARARGHVLGWPAPAGSDASERLDTLTELACDVCLFVRLDEKTKRSPGDK